MGYDDVYSQASLYHVTADIADERCIAPRASRDRCGSQWLDFASKRTIQDLDNKITTSTEPCDIVKMMLELVLCRCNTFGGHREKLASRPRCHRDVAELYLDEYTRLKLLRVNVPRDLDIINAHTIRPGTLVPFVPAEPATLSAVLRRKLPLYRSNGQPFATEGVVYGFTSTAYPDVVKIGYSGKSAQVRMDDLRNCMPNGRIVLEVDFDWPERIEELIHIELLGQRRKVAKCIDPSCNSSHQEFFELPVEEIELLFQDWSYIVKESPLYDSKTRMLTPTWSRRLQAMTVSATAWELRKILQKEAQERAQEEVAQAKKALEAITKAKQASQVDLKSVSDKVPPITSKPQQQRYNLRSQTDVEAIPIKIAPEPSIKNTSEKCSPMQPAVETVPVLTTSKQPSVTVSSLPVVSLPTSPSDTEELKTAKYKEGLAAVEKTQVKMLDTFNRINLKLAKLFEQVNR